MKLVNIEAAELQSVLAIAELGSFRAAALALGCSQPAITARIQRVEATLGLKLFHRTTRRVTITEAGERLRLRAERTVADLINIVQELNDEAHLKRGRVALGATSTVAASIIPPVIKTFKQQWPGVDIVLVDDFFGRELDRLASGDVDFAVIPFDPEQRHFNFQRLLDDTFMLMVPANHPLSVRRDVELEELANLSIVSFPRQSTAWAAIARAFAEAGLSYDPSILTRNILTLTAMVRANLGIAFVAQLVIPQLDLSGLKLLPLKHRTISRQIGVATLRGKPLQPAAQAFVKLLRSQLALSARRSSSTSRR
ncbi:LysR family transcriptional regulator [Bradyrhizobium sp. Ai1a-2]|uniref:LysR family transcriptional regulator n=1 Tax=Bradyrhizobium sp. Ai1a-2 TaxID=196490 RepID=UPI0003F98029|nr:LysR family transcriptional regulator [Bradyrhizobium sp. Ai1a-2]